MDPPEIIYGTQSEEGHVMSEKVSSLATNIYKEFERMIKKYDEDVVKELMPLTVGLLEGLDRSLCEKQESEVEIELLKDDNEQLLTQYEREKQLRKAAEQKYLEVEDAIEGEKRKLQNKTESMEQKVRMLELKAKNSSDHISRMEEKEAETKKEYSKLHDRYTELFRTHCDYMERTKILIGPDKIDLSNSPRQKFNLPNLRPVSMMLPGQTFSPLRSSTDTPPSMSLDMTTPGSQYSNTSLKSELNDLDSPDISNNDNIKRRKSSEKAKGTCDKNQMTDEIDVKDSGTTTKKNKNAELPEEKTDSVKSDKETENLDRGDSKSENTSQMQGSEQSVDRTELSESVQQTQLVIPESDNSVIQSPDINAQITSQGPTKLVTSTPEAKRDRLDSFDEADFEEDTIPGLDHINVVLQHIVETTPELHKGFEESVESVESVKMQRNDNSIFDELNMPGTDLNDDDFGITDSDDENERRSTVSDNFFGMGKELENLILENTELLETKNALNIVKDDLIAKVDELSSEQEILKEEISSLKGVKEKLNQRIKDLEDDLKKTKEELEKKSTVNKEEDEDDVPMAQRKRFTRVEMARVLMERNQYKERLMELQEAVRWTEMIRASREHPDISTAPHNKKKSSIWNFFGNLVAPDPPPPPTPSKKGKSKTQII